MTPRHSITAQVTVATSNGDQITLAPNHLAPLVHRLDCLYMVEAGATRDPAPRQLGRDPWSR